MKKTSALILGLALVFFVTAGLRGEEETKYTNDSFGRLSFANGKVFIQRTADAKPEEAVVNAPLEEGNKVLTNDGRAEIYFGKSNYARLDDNSSLEIITLPKKGADQTRLRVLGGSVYVSINTLGEEKSIEVHSPDASFYVLGEGLYRIDVRENKGTNIFVFRGVIEAAGESGSQLLKSEEKLEAVQGKFSSSPRRFYAVAEDGFDRWNQSRESQVASRIGNQRLPEELKDFEGELDENGDWVYQRPYGWVWVPSNVGDDWRPYYNGSWTWLALGGWTWTPYETWGWAPFHYGRWGWGAGLGWYWIPTSVWGPAWVNWWWGADYWAWAPMSWWGYPGVLFDGYFYDHWTGFYPYRSRALTVVRRDHLRDPHISSAALRGGELRTLDRMTLSAHSPSLRPAEGRLSASSLGGRVFPRRESLGNISGLRPMGSQGGQMSTLRRSGFGYPPSGSISVRRFGSTSDSIRSRFYNYIQGNRSSSSRYSSSRYSSSRGSSSSYHSRGSYSSGSRSSFSGSHGSFRGSSGGRGGRH